MRRKGTRKYIVREQLRDHLRSPQDVWHLLMASSLCLLGWHCRPASRVRKFNGGNPVLLCCHCRMIVARE